MKNIIKRFILSLFIAAIAFPMAAQQGEPTGITGLNIEIYKPVSTINNSAPAVTTNTGTFTDRNGRRIEYRYTFPNANLRNNSTMKIVFAMHGNGRNHVSTMNSFSYLSRAENICVIAPLFDRERFANSEYNNINISPTTPYEEWTFNTIDSLFLDFVRQHNLPARKYILYGHSAGAQFAHRTAIFSRSQYIDYVIAANAGFYTFLDENNYSNGIRNMVADYKSVILSNLSNRKLYIIIGSNDNDPNAADFNPTYQGNTRYEKALNFTRVALNYAAENKVSYNWETFIMEGVEHNQSQTRPYVLDIITGKYQSKSAHINARLVEQIAYNDLHFSERLKMEMVRVAGGTFTMGATPEQGDDARSNERPAHSVTLSGFQIGKYEVTQRQWKLVMGIDNNPSNRRGDDLPVERVSWDDIQVFITKLNELTGMRYRLPTEAEWEYAARGGNQSRGYKYSGSNNIDEVAWYTGNSGGRTNPVGTKKANELGIHDMSGNVIEWVNDRWSSAYTAAAKTNPTGPATGANRARRGGGYSNAIDTCRVSHRSGNSPTDFYSNFGFRLALD